LKRVPGTRALEPFFVRAVFATGTISTIGDDFNLDAIREELLVGRSSACDAAMSMFIDEHCQLVARKTSVGVPTRSVPNR
jgi:hypothetical protein